MMEEKRKFNSELLDALRKKEEREKKREEISEKKLVLLESLINKLK